MIWCSGVIASSPISLSLYLSFWSHTSLKPKPDSTTESLTFQDDGALKGKVSISQNQVGRGGTVLTKENFTPELHTRELYVRSTT